MFLLLFPLLIQQDSIEALVRKLGSESVEERDEATRSLVARVDDAQAELEKAAGDADFEVAGRARQILATLSPYRRGVAADMSHLRTHGERAYRDHQFEDCLAYCDAMLHVDCSFAPALDLIDAARRAMQDGEPSAIPDDPEPALRFPLRAEWPSIRERAFSTVPCNPGSCWIAVRCTLESLRIDMDFRDAKYEDVLLLIRDLSGLILVMDARNGRAQDMVEKKVTFRAKDRPLSECLGEILSQAGDDYTITGEGVILIREFRY